VAIEISSHLSPDELTNRIEAFIKEWRDSKIPVELRKRGVWWCGGRTNGRSFVLSLQNPQIGFALNCTGTVLPTQLGSRIVATTITAPEVLKGALLVSLVSALVALVWTVKRFTWPVFLGATLRFAFFWAVIGFGMMALSRRPNERDYRAILEQLAS
jgi:hypothetical protein